MSVQTIHAQQQNAQAVLNNAAVIKLVRAGFKEKTVIAIIRTRPTQFDLTPDRLIELKRSGVSEQIILAMLARTEPGFIVDDEWGDDPYFKDSDNPTRSKKGSGTGDGSTGIFGSSGGSSASSRTGGIGGGAEGNTDTTGSATVRILRPPLEEGGAPKLEKTPTLTNDSIVELVEAGFSEGTIIRRIQQSPAEFDLTSQKLAELRKRRVTEPVINAMREAMGEEEKQKQ
ncbi:MAG: hypothetical protein WBP93_10045 [Pyrinomonadaceae bacterium]